MSKINALNFLTITFGNNLGSGYDTHIPALAAAFEQVVESHPAIMKNYSWIHKDWVDPPQSCNADAVSYVVE